MTAKTDPDRQRFKQMVRRRLSGLTRENGVEGAKATVISANGEEEIVDLLEDELAHKIIVHTDSPTRHPDPDEIRDDAVTSSAEHRAVILRAIENSRGRWRLVTSGS